MIEPPRKRRTRRTVRNRWLAGIAAAVVLFAAGIALGEALRDNPKPNLTVTSTKTIVP
ncbi:MAG TPA: hypothetical protein VIG35_09355 [Gaiellaceae bacterium]